jgi:hypothetical protein
VKLLINGATITQIPRHEVAYWHVELPVHDVIYSEAMPTESYLDTGNRSDFENGGPALSLHPDFANEVWNSRASYPQMRDGPVLAALHETLVQRAVAIFMSLAALQLPGNPGAKLCNRPDAATVA